MSPRGFLLLIGALLCQPAVEAKVIGMNVAPSPLSLERIQGLPAEQQAAWKAYLDRSESAKRVDMDKLRQEMRTLGLAQSIPAPKTHNAALPLKKPAEWYGSAEALFIADCLLSYQTPTGGWGKNTEMTKEPRKAGQHFVSANSTSFPMAGDNDADPQDGWAYVGTFDNGATISQLRFLAKVVTAVGGERGEPYRAAFMRGLGYLFDAQYPNGGYPQVYPLMGGYHDAITMNDGAMISIIEELQDLADGEDGYGWIPAEARARARACEGRALACVLACQIRVKDGLTVWGQQHDLLTLAPAPARNYEMPCECAGESAEITLFLMRVSNPTPEMVRAVKASATWFEKVALHGVAFKSVNGDRVLVDAPGAAPLWARFYDLNTHLPIFGDRDKTIHDDVSEISKERRKGYSWYSSYGNRVQDHYAKWSRQH